MYVLSKDKLSIGLLENGAVEKIMSHDIMVNQVQGNILDGSLGNLYLRTMDKDKHYRFAPLLGPNTHTRFSVSQDSAKWQSSILGIAYTVTLYLAQQKWFWCIDLVSNSQQDIIADVFYTQDLGLGLPSFVSSNEAYASQYIDHHVQRENDHIIVSSRQNQSQKGRLPYLQEGSLGSLKSYSTDGFQFFGSQYKETGVAQALKETTLRNYNYQYEFALTALQTFPTKITTEKHEQIVFYAAFSENNVSDNQKPVFSDKDMASEFDFIVNQQRQFQDRPVIRQKSELSSLPIVSEEFSKSELNDLFPDRLQTEYHGDTLLSFFRPDGRHVVLKAKEKEQERPTGNIVMATTKSMPTTKVLATTHYMMGTFASQTVFGNSNMNQFSINTRNPLNILKMQGMHLYLRQGNQYRLLSLPTAFQMSYNASDWYYKLSDDLIKISADAMAQQPQLTFRFVSAKHKKYDLIVTDQIIMGSESDGLPKMDRKNLSLIFYPQPSSLMSQRDPELRFDLSFGQHDADQMTIGSEEELLTSIPNPSKPSLLLFRYENVSDFTLTLLAYQEEKPLEVIRNKTVESRLLHISAMEKMIRGFQLSGGSPVYADQIARTNLIVRWFAHDALVHLLSPHGLEQYGGAAWGTRDVSQGPTEFFLATQHFSEVKKIIEILYSHQFIGNGSWPQWFMFDEYGDQFADESHGDVVIWPLKVVSDYIRLSGDRDILTMQLPYMDMQAKKLTVEQETLLSHIQRQVEYVKKHFLYDTKVSAYGDGDWDDTLQPATNDQKKTMASTWTEELTIQVFKEAAKALSGNFVAEELSSLASAMLQDFQKYFMKTADLPGFIRLYPDHHTDPIIYPQDSATHIQYRLIPFTRAIISGILSQTQIQRTLAIIDKHLLFPDGVRLMNRPARYSGGISHIFKRAEQSANFGREIGLMYTHAHIRYAEALATAGDSRAWHALQIVNPINLNKLVKNAVLRQANVYFSSSDANFKDRYEAESHFGELRHAGVAVKGGWRLYSSGPGIYINQLFSKIFGLDFHSGQLIAHAILPKDMVNAVPLTLRYDTENARYEVIFGTNRTQIIKK